MSVLLFMERKPDKTEYRLLNDIEALIPFEEVRKFVLAHRLGNHVSEIYQELVSRLLNASQQGVPLTVEYANGILRNLIRGKRREIGRHKKMKKRLTELKESDFKGSHKDCPDEKMEKKELHDKVRRGITNLTERQTTIVNLRVYHSFTSDQVSQVIGIGRRMVQIEFKRALESLQRYVDNEEHEH